MASHAQVPTALVLEDRIRVYIAVRTPQGKALIGCVDLDRGDLRRVVEVHSDPVLGFGQPGTFDEDGVMPSEAFFDGDEVRLYYSGWNQKVTTPYHNATGLAVSRDRGATFARAYYGPVMERTAEEPYLAVTPTVIKLPDRYRCWYISGLRWVAVDGKFEPVYAIKRAESRDGVHWERPSPLCIPQRHDLEAFSRPCVRVLNGSYHMWYCFRESTDYRDGAGSYRMGYATSDDGVSWKRCDELAGIAPSTEGWDSTMICYPYVFEADSRLFMLYNGNGFGRSGFGVAEWEM
jgi:hypothetical protein